jgi:hypothetical protein
LHTNSLSETLYSAKIHLHTKFKAKDSRWVYERGARRAAGGSQSKGVGVLQRIVLGIRSGYGKP